jgi:calcium-dependent protein kinase
LLDFYGAKISEEEANEIFKKVDADNNGFIDYSEFVLASMDHVVLLDKKKLRAVFKKLDKDKSGSIETNEINEMFKYHALSEK